MDDAGVGDSFEEYVAGRGRALLRFAYVLCRDQELSKDLVQDALIRTHARWHRVDSPDAYVRKAIVNDFLSWKRRRSSRDVVTDQLPETAVDPGHHEDRDAMWRVLAVLPRQQRAVLVLRFYEELDDDAIGRTLGCSAATVRSHASKALATLRAGDASTRYAEGSAR
jgi:RNA polymerase sigma-70 factor (sigma-E family)